MKNKRVLYIDPLSHRGHINFNNIYINALYSYNVKIDFAVKSGYESALNVSKDATIFPIPEKKYKQTKSIILSRFYLFRIFRYIINNINLEKYDFILMSSFEEISLFLANFTTPLILVHHNNFRSLNSPFKSYFYKKVVNRNTNIVFEQYMKEHLEYLGVKDIYVVKHGLPKAMNKSILLDSSTQNQFNKPHGSWMFFLLKNGIVMTGVFYFALVKLVYKGWSVFKRSTNGYPVIIGLSFLFSLPVLSIIMFSSKLQILFGFFISFIYLSFHFSSLVEEQSLFVEN